MHQLLESQEGKTGPKTISKKLPASCSLSWQQLLKSFRKPEHLKTRTETAVLGGCSLRTVVTGKPAKDFHGARLWLCMLEAATCCECWESRTLGAGRVQKKPRNNHQEHSRGVSPRDTRSSGLFCLLRWKPQSPGHRSCRRQSKPLFCL